MGEREKEKRGKTFIDFGDVCLGLSEFLDGSMAMFGFYFPIVNPIYWREKAGNRLAKPEGICR